NTTTSSVSGSSFGFLGTTLFVPIGYNGGQISGSSTYVGHTFASLGRCRPFSADCCSPWKPLTAIRNFGRRQKYFLLRSTAWLSDRNSLSGNRPDTGRAQWQRLSMLLLAV